MCRTICQTLNYLLGSIPTRMVIGIMIFMACLFSYMLRVNMSINLIAMVQPRINADSGEASIPECLIVNNVTQGKNVTNIPDVSIFYLYCLCPEYDDRNNWAEINKINFSNSQNNNFVKNLKN